LPKNSSKLDKVRYFEIFTIKILKFIHK